MTLLLLVQPMMLQVVLGQVEDHKLGQVEVQVHHILKQPMMVPLMLEEEDHQLEGGEVEAEAEEEEAEAEAEEAEAEEEGLLLCSMFTIDHCLGYVIISG